MVMPWEEEAEYNSRLAGLFKGRNPQTLEQYMAPRPPSPRRPGSAQSGGRPGSARPQSPRMARPGSARPQSPRMQQLSGENAALQEELAMLRPTTPRGRADELYSENDELRRQVERLNAKLVYAAASGRDFSQVIPGSRPGTAPRKKLSNRITGGMNHEQMVYEAKLRNEFNKKRQNFKGLVKLAAGKNADEVPVDELELAAKLAKMAVPSDLMRPQSPRQRLAGVVPWKSVLGGVEYPTIGTETVKLEAARRAEAKREKIRKENEVAVMHRVKVLEEAEEEDISEDELRKAHAQIRDHFMTRFSQVRRGFRMLDEDSSGKLTYAELKSVVMMFNLKIPAKIVQKIIELADWDGSGDIDYAEFARIISAEDIVYLKDSLTADDAAMGQGTTHVKTKGLKGKAANREGPATLRPGVTENEVRYAQRKLREELEEKYSTVTKAFKFIDADRTGKLEREEVKRLLVEFNIVDVSDGAIESLIDFADFDGDGEINYAEFARILTADDVVRHATDHQLRLTAHARTHRARHTPRTHARETATMLCTSHATHLTAAGE